MTAHPAGGQASPARLPREPGPRVRLGPAEAAIFETFVVPRYLSLFGEIALEGIIESDDAQVVHLNCRTGYPDRGLAIRLPGAYIVGVDVSASALELARAKAATMPDMVSDYRLVEEWPTSLPESAFSHALALHVRVGEEDRRPLLLEAARLLAPHGQLLLAMPVRGSFQEILDLLREFALKHDDTVVGAAVEHAASMRPTVETLRDELESAGFDFVDVRAQTSTLRFQGGRDFFEDPIARLMILPELRWSLDIGERADKALAYVREAIDKYWSDRSFELTVNVGCALGRRRP